MKPEINWEFLERIADEMREGNFEYVIMDGVTDKLEITEKKSRMKGRNYQSRKGVYYLFSVARDYEKCSECKSLTEPKKKKVNLYI